MSQQCVLCTSCPDFVPQVDAMVAVQDESDIAPPPPNKVQCSCNVLALLAETIMIGLTVEKMATRTWGILLIEHYIMTQPAACVESTSHAD